jgi:hypothetical protein
MMIVLALIYLLSISYLAKRAMMSKICYHSACKDFMGLPSFNPSSP